MSHSYDYDTIIIGSGSDGEGVAMDLAGQGARVAVIERYHNVGGGYTHWGAIPSEALRHVVSRITEFDQDPLYSDHSRLLRSSFVDILNHADSVTNQQMRIRQGFYECNYCEILRGSARFVDERMVTLECHDGAAETLTADKLVITCGSRPYRPVDADLLHPRVYDSNSILSLHHGPHRVLIYGAGVIGYEYASIFRGMDVGVGLINARDRLLVFLDQEIPSSLPYHFWNNGVVIRYNGRYKRIGGRDDGVIMHLKSGKRLKADYLLHASNRTGNISSLALGDVGLKADNHGRPKANSICQTVLPHMYAVEGATGYPNLVSVTYSRGRIVTQVLVEDEATAHLIKGVPAGVYTVPEISSVDKTGQQLTIMEIPYEVDRARFKHLAHAQIVSVSVGTLKILFHCETREILGIHCFRERVAKIIHIGQAIIGQESGDNTIKYFVNTTLNCPTTAETYRIVALNGLNRLP